MTAYASQLGRLQLPSFAPPKASPPFLVALEGPNGAGKTTLSRRLGRMRDAHCCLGTPPAWFAKSLKARMIRDAEWFASAMFFLSGCCEQMRSIRALSKRLVIMDRCLWSTLAVHAAENPERLATLISMLEPIAHEIVIPHLTIVLEASFDTCLARIGQKNPAVRALDHLTANTGFHAREQAFYHWLARQNLPVQFLDVNNLNPRQAAQHAQDLIRASVPASIDPLVC